MLRRTNERRIDGIRGPIESSIIAEEPLNEDLVDQQARHDTYEDVYQLKRSPSVDVTDLTLIIIKEGIFQ